MPFLSEPPRFKGMSLPPSGWALAILLAVYIFTGLLGHDPWKSDDVISLGIAHDMIGEGNWLMPHLAGRPYPDAPFYYWTAAAFGKFFSWLLPEHEAARLASGLYTLLALEFILLAARELHGRDYAAAAPLVLAGSIGFLFHAHEAQPMLASLTAHTAAYWALILLPRRPRFAALVFAIALALGFLANGVLPVLTLLPVTIFSLFANANRKHSAAYLLTALLVAALLCGTWLAALYIASPAYLEQFWQSELTSISEPLRAYTNVPRYLNLLLWYAWPALPLAAWTLWSKRRALLTRPLALPIVGFVAVLTILGLLVEVRSAAALLLLPPLVLLAVPGVATLRRGAANAFDSFAMLTFSLFAVIVWIVWCAMVFGWPARLARQAVRLEPGFVGVFSATACAFALLATIVWGWMIVTSPRSPMRGIMHWMAGLTLFWLLIALLWMPWIDYGKSYRPVSASLARALPTKVSCIANGNLPDSILASLDYFDAIRTVPLRETASQRCDWLVTLGAARDPNAIRAAGWRQVWEGKRPGDRRESDKFRLYRREVKKSVPAALSEIIVEPPEDAKAR